MTSWMDTSAWTSSRTDDCVGYPGALALKLAFLVVMLERRLSTAGGENRKCMMNFTSIKELSPTYHRHCQIGNLSDLSCVLGFHTYVIDGRKSSDKYN